VTLPQALLRVEQGVLVAALALATLIPLAEATGRALGANPVPGAAAYIQHLTMWLAFAGGLLATREEKHLMLSTAEFLGHGKVKQFARFVSHALAAATCGVLAYASAQVVAENRSSGTTLAIGLPAWISECVMPLALGLMALRFAWHASERWGLRALAAAAIPGVFALSQAQDFVTSTPWPFAIVILACAVLGAPVFTVMGSLALLLFFKDQTPVAAVSLEIYRLIASPTLPAIPLLTAAGYVLAEGQASTRLLRLFRSLFGWLPGGLAVMVAALLAVFTTFTGGSGVTIIALGGLVMPMLLKDRYSESFSTGLVTASGSLGLLFPPSLPVILYSVVASQRDMSVPADELYIAGLLPGLLMVGLVVAWAMWQGRSAGERQPFAVREVFASAWGAKWELALPLCIVYLFASGRASMVETAAAALFYAAFVSVVITRDITVTKGLVQALAKSAVLTGSVLILLSAAMGTTSYIVDAQIPDLLLGWVKEHIHSPLVFLLALNVLLLIVGCLVDLFSAIVVLAPLIAPMGAAFGIDPVHLGVIFIANLELGFLTPPVGMNLFLSSSRFGKPLLQVYKDAFPFLLILTVGVLLITYAPVMSIGVLELLGKR
jgi:C4-dicarboxylate transporter DctM subunit